MWRRLFVLLVSLYLLLCSREPPWADAHVAYDTTQALVDRGSLAISTQAPAYFFTFNQGRKYGFASLGNVLALAPSYLTYRLLHGLFPKALPQEPLFALTSHLSSIVLSALACVVFGRLCLQLGAGAGTALLLSLTLGLGTICLCYARSPYSEALQTLCLTATIERLLAQARRPSRLGLLGLGAVAGVLVNAKVIYALCLLPCAAYFIYARFAKGQQLRQILAAAPWVLVGMAGPLLCILWHNWVKTGSPLRTGYYDHNGLFFAGDLLGGLYGYTLSSGKGLLFYSPPLLLGLLGFSTLWRRFRAEALLLLGVVGVTMAIHAKYYIWHGDHSWGPRYMVPLTPLLLAPAAPWLGGALLAGRRRLRRAALCGLLLCGLFVQGLGASLYWDHYIRVLLAVRAQTTPAWSEDHLPFGYFVPQFSPLRGHLWLLRHYARGDGDLMRDAPFRLLLPVPLRLSGEWSRVRIDWWALDWLVVERGAVPLSVGIGLIALWSGLGLWAGVGLLRRRS